MFFCISSVCPFLRFHLPLFQYSQTMWPCDWPETTVAVTQCSHVWVCVCVWDSREDVLMLFWFSAIPVIKTHGSLWQATTGGLTEKRRLLVSTHWHLTDFTAWVRSHLPQLLRITVWAAALLSRHSPIRGFLSFSSYTLGVCPGFTLLMHSFCYYLFFPFCILNKERHPWHPVSPPPHSHTPRPPVVAAAARWEPVVSKQLIKNNASVHMRNYIFVPWIRSVDAKADLIPP